MTARYRLRWAPSSMSVEAGGGSKGQKVGASDTVSVGYGPNCVWRHGWRQRPRQGQHAFIGTGILWSCGARSPRPHPWGARRSKGPHTGS